MKNTAEYWISTLKLQAHPEGGYFSEVYRSPEVIQQKSLPYRFSGSRSFATSIYFLLKSGECSKFHRIQSDEIWHFYKGQPISIHVISPDGEYSVLKLGSNPEKGESLQHVVPAGYWFGAEVASEDGFALVGCSVSPGFDFEDFELADETLAGKFPMHSEIINRLV